MKRLFILPFIFAFAALSTNCKEEDGGEQFDVEISIKTPNITLYASEKGDTALVVNAKNVTWKPVVADDAREWLSAEKKNNTVVIKVTDNDTAEDRSGKVYIEVTNSNRVEGTELSVLQYGQGTMSVSATSLEFEASGNKAQTFEVVGTKLKWEASSNDDWVTVTSSGNTVTVKVKDNANYRKLNGKVTISPVSADYLKPHVVAINQSGVPFEADHTFTATTGSYHGKVKASDFARYSFQFGSGNARVITGDHRVEVGDGYLLQIDSLLGDIASNSTNIFLPAGKYEILSEDKAGVIRPGGYDADADFYYGTVLYEKTAGATSATHTVSGGSVEVERGTESYKLYFDLILQGGAKMKFLYEGKIKLKNDTYFSTLKENRDVEGLVGAKMKCTKAKDEKKINTWNLYMWTEGITIGDNGSASGTGRYFSLELYTGINDNEKLPAGTFTFSDSQEEKTARLGYMESNAYKGSWYFEMKSGSTKPTELAPFNGGSVTVSFGKPTGEGEEETELEYTITITGRDDSPTTPFDIKGTYKGKITLIE